MAKHKFDGDWRYLEIDGKNFPPNPHGTEEAMKLNIPDEVTGKLEAGSKRKFDLTGNASGKKIKMKEKDNAAGVDIDYVGELVFELPGVYMVVAGTFKDNSEKAGRKADGQDDGTWIITRP